MTPFFKFPRIQLAALIASLLLSACTSPEVAAARLAQIHGFQNVIETNKAAAQAGDKAARYELCIANYELAEIVRNRPQTDQAWEWCSSVAKEGQYLAQYITGYLLTNFQPSYSWDMEGPERYGEAIYWYKQSMEQGYDLARKQYAYYTKWYDKEYGSGKSDLFGKILAGAFVVGIGAYAKAGAATTANAVGAFAADASTNGRAQASAGFLKNARAPQQLPQAVTTSAADKSRVQVAQATEEREQQKQAASQAARSSSQGAVFIASAAGSETQNQRSPQNAVQQRPRAQVAAAAATSTVQSRSTGANSSGSSGSSADSSSTTHATKAWPTEPAGTRRSVNGTMYVSVYAVLENNKGNKQD